MRQLSLPLILLILFTVVISGCQKTSSDSANPRAATDPIVTTPTPTATFKINNAAGSGTLWEGLDLTIDNSSQHADSYFWDFGNGITSTEKTPSNISLFPCGVTYTISLTVKNGCGQSVTYSSPYSILCSRGMGFGSHHDKNP